MSHTTSNIRLSAAVAARSALVIAGTVLATAIIRLVLNGLFNRHWQAEWQVVFGLAAIFGLGWFVVTFVYTWIKLRANDPVEAILTREPSQDDMHKAPLSGFVAMEYYSLILNRTFVVFVAPEGLYGWKAEGVVTATQPMYFEPYAGMLQDPELIRDREAIRRLSNLKGGFFIPHSAIISVDVVYKQKWGMGPIPHSGRVRIGMASGRSREFILLGSVDAESIRQRILGATSGGRIPDAPHVSLPYVARYQKKIWVPLFVFWTALSAWYAWNLNETWKTSDWAFRVAMLVMIGVPLPLLLEFVVQSVRFTDTEIQRTTRLGRVTTFPYSAIRKLSTASDAFVAIELSDGRKLKLHSWQGNPREVLSILQTKTKLTVGASAV